MKCRRLSGAIAKAKRRPKVGMSEDVVGARRMLGLMAPFFFLVSALLTLDVRVKKDNDR